MIGNRTAKKSLGFSLTPATPSVGKQSKMKMMEERHKKEDALLKLVEPDDLHKFGLIPEFVGRLQVLCSINNLTEGDFDAVFYRTYPLLYHKFGNMVIFWPGNLYSLCSPGNHQKIIFFSAKKVEIGHQSSITKNI